jgi:hypothetical protein
MKDRVVGAIFLVVIAVAAIVFFKSNLFGKNINITISDSRNELSLVASFPIKYSEEVQGYIKSELNMTDLPDLKFVEVKRYQTPDHEMRFHIKSRDGYLKIVLDKRDNDHESVYKLKEIGKGVEEILTSN